MESSTDYFLILLDKGQKFLLKEYLFSIIQVALWGKIHKMVDRVMASFALLIEKIFKLFFTKQKTTKYNLREMIVCKV